ncbi:phage/plasmid replication protein, II/X family [Acinetobacter brisouii]
MTLVSTTLATEGTLYSVDWLKVVVYIDHDQHSLNDGIRVDIRRSEDGYNTEDQMQSFRPIWVRGSYSSQLKIKSLSESALQIEGNFYKWLYGQNVTGSPDLVSLVFDVVKALAAQHATVMPTQEQLEAIKQGLFKVSIVDINKALLFQDKQEARRYLERLKHNSSYPYRKKDIENNGVYFGKTSKRWLLKYYHKGTEVIVNRKHQKHITVELQALADLMIRCEMRLKWRQLSEWDLLTGDKWDAATVIKLIDDAHKKLRLPEPVALPDMPSRYVKFLSCVEAGTVVDCYSTNTISKMKADLIREYGIHLN